MNLWCFLALSRSDEAQKPSGVASRMETDLDEDEADLAQKQVAFTL